MARADPTVRSIPYPLFYGKCGASHAWPPAAWCGAHSTPAARSPTSCAAKLRAIPDFRHDGMDREHLRSVPTTALERRLLTRSCMSNKLATRERTRPLFHRVGDRYSLPPTSVHDDHSRIRVTTPAPTVLLPSRMAKRDFTCNAIGLSSSTVSSALSPGSTISAPSVSSMVPVTSVVRK